MSSQYSRPYVIVNCAMSVDGKIALATGKRLRISSATDLKRVQRLRNECDAILVGINTILSDNPSLIPKTPAFKKRTKKYYRVVLDTDCRIPLGSKVLATTKKVRTIIATTQLKDMAVGECEILTLPPDKNGFVDLKKLLAQLYRKGIKKILVEGGGTVIQSFLKQKLVDEIWLYVGNIIIGGKSTPTFAAGTGASKISELCKLKLISVTKARGGILLHYKPK